MHASQFAATISDKKLVTYDTFCRNHSVISVFEATAYMLFEIKMLTSKFLHFPIDKLLLCSRKISTDC